MNWNELKHMIFHINWEQFHFLRPKALYLFIPLVVIVLLLIIGNREKRRWKQVIAKPLRPFMFSKGSKWAIILPLLSFILASSFIILALAGPTWEKKKIPGQKIQAVTLISLDLSRSMLATDIQPSRIERAKLKIIDLLDANPRTRTGLIAFAGTAHPVLPFTSDYKLIKFHAASLENRVMPVQGSNIEVLLNVVDTLMHNIQAPSTVVLMTDVIDSDDAVLLTNYFNSSVHHLELLLFSTPQGGKIPGTDVVSKQDQSVLNNLRQSGKIIITPLTLDKSDVEDISKRISDNLVFEQDNKKDEKEWEDMGWLLIIPALFIAVFWFRKGWVIRWCVIPIIAISSFSSCNIDSKYANWWYTKDYQGQLLENAGREKEAAERYNDISHKAVAYFKAGNYAEAADLFALDSSATGLYNRALALAALGRYDDAITVFEQAAEKDPALKDRANKSITRTKQRQLEADSVNRYDTQTARHLDKKDNKDKSPLKERKPESEDEKLSSDTKVDKLPDQGERITDEVASNIHKAKEQKSPPKDFKLDKDFDPSTQILLQQTKADPGEFLHRRFELQKERYFKNVKESKNNW